jgi:hypothetical protein
LATERLPGQPISSYIKKGNTMQPQKNEDRLRYIRDSLPELSNDIIQLIYKIIFYAQSGLE